MPSNPARKLELHLADQLLLPLALAAGAFAFTASRPTGHLLTNAWTIDQFKIAHISIEEGKPYRVRIEPHGFTLKAANLRLVGSQQVIASEFLASPHGMPGAIINGIDRNYHVGVRDNILPGIPALVVASTMASLNSRSVSCIRRSCFVPRRCFRT